MAARLSGMMSRMRGALEAGGRAYMPELFTMAGALGFMHMAMQVGCATCVSLHVRLINQMYLRWLVAEAVRC